MRNMLMGLFLLFPGSREENKPPEFAPIETEFPLIWKAKTGNASFRSNWQFTNNEVIMGSNGEDFWDYGIYDKQSGVYVLDRKTGKIQRKFANERVGDMDVNGVLLYKGRYYFGNDNEEFLCTDLTGKIMWRNLASGDVEHEPVLIRIAGKDHMVYASETGEVRAVDPATGNMAWVYYTDDFSGYKTGDNRNVFKVKSYFTNTQSFFTKPVVADLNRDGIKDLVYLTYDNKVYAINGKNGSLLWLYNSPHNTSFDLISSGYGDDLLLTMFEVRPPVNGNNDSYVYDTYLLSLNREGKNVSEVLLEQGKYNPGLHHFTGKDGNPVIVTADSVYILEKGRPVRSIYHANNYDQVSPGYVTETVNGRDEIVSSYQSYTHKTVNRNSRDAIIASSVFPYAGHSACIMVVNQWDDAIYSKGFIEIISLDAGKPVANFALPGSPEMPPQIMDVNHDGYLDLLINCRNETTYCFNMKIPAR